MELEVIILFGILLVFAVVAPLFSPFFRKPVLSLSKGATLQEEDSTVSTPDSIQTLPPVSIIITDHDNAYQLSKIIDGFLTQDYPADYQVIVVVDETDHESLDVLKQRVDNPHLYYTKLPVTSRYISRKKLAMTVGLRASKYDWCIVTSVYCSVSDDQWLQAFCRNMSEDVNMVMGMTPYESCTPHFWRYEQLRTMLYYLTGAENGTAFSTNQLLVAIRKEEFFSQQGFAGNLEYQRAEFEFLVNKFAMKGKTALALEPSSWLTCKEPTKKQWYYRHMHCMDSFRDMKHSTLFRMLYHTDMTLMHLYNILTSVSVIVGVLIILGVIAQPQTNGIIIVAVSTVLWIISQIVRMRIYKSVLHYFHNVNPLIAILFDWRLSWSNLFIRIRYKFTDRYDFMTHRL